MIICDLDIPKLTQEGIHLKGSFREVKELYGSSMI